MAAQGALGTDFYDRSTRTIVGTMLWAEYRPVGPKGALGSHEIRPIHSAPSLGQSIAQNMLGFCDVTLVSCRNCHERHDVTKWDVHLIQSLANWGPV